MKKKLVQINVVCNGSTGRIMNQIQAEAQNQGWDAYSFYGRGKPANDKCVKIGNKLDVLFHVLVTRLFDKHGHGSKSATKKLIKQIEEINPDVIQLHNLHGYYLHLETLFNYLKRCNKRIVWTLHDCWAFTGHCSHFTYPKCNKWQSGCEKCIRKKDYPQSIFLDNSKNEFNLKKQLFIGVNNLTIITPSQWLADLVKKSFLRNYEVKVINNGIDLNIFKPTNTINVKEKYNIPEYKKIVLGVSSIWNESKGLGDFIKLSSKLDANTIIVLVGLNKKQIKKLPKNIIGIQKTDNIEELVNLYTLASVLYNPSKEETFSLVTVESIACGTPVIAYDNSAITELIDERNGVCLFYNTDNYEEIIDNINNLNKIEDINVKKYSFKKMTNKYILEIYGKELEE